jgi:prostaglandin-H2 D-isomerase / glutathione transferase
VQQNLLSPLDPSWDKIKLTYFDIHGGRAEAARLALQVGNIAFEDRRFAFSEFAKVRESTPLNQVPTLRVNDLQVTQSGAITRYVGKLAGLYPENALQALLCDEVMDALEDVNIKIAATFGLTGDALKTARLALVGGPLPQYLQWLQQQLDSHGGVYFADNRLTIADLKVFVNTRALNLGNLDHVPTGLVEAVVPKLNAHMQLIASIPATAQYYAKALLLTPT